MKMVEFDIHSILRTQKGRYHAGVQVGGGDKNEHVNNVSSLQEGVCMEAHNIRQ